MSKNAPLRLEAATEDGKAKWPQSNTKRQMLVAPNAPVVLEAVPTKDATLAPVKVRFYDGDVLLGEAAQAPWKMNWKSDVLGAHGLSAEWGLADGTRGVANPGLVVVGKGAAPVQVGVAP